MSDKPTVTQEQADQRVEELIQAATAGVDPKLRLEREIDPPGDLMHCLDPSDGGSEERIQVSRKYWLRDLPADEKSNVARQILAHWKSQGYTIDRAAGLETGEPNIFGWTKPNEFSFSVQTTSDGEMSIGTTSPCIWQSGTPGVEATGMP